MIDIENDGGKKDKDETEDGIIKAMMKRWNLSNSAESHNRKRFLEAKKFALGGEFQWDPKIYELRGEDNMPRDTYNQIPQFTHQITNDGRLNETETKFIPADDTDQSKETAEKREDIARKIQADPQAQVAYDTALENCVEGGWGYWRYITEYENDKSFDQVIRVVWMPNPLVVYDDPNCIRADRLDRQFLFQTSDIPKAEFDKSYPNKDYDSSTLVTMGDSSSDWMSSDYVRIAEYWSVDEVTTKLYRNKKTGEITEETPKKISDYDVRDVKKCKVIWRKVTAFEVLEEKEWAGEYIPYVFVAGEEKVVDGKKYLTGLVEHMMAPQRAFNYQSNSIQYMTALAPKSPWIASVRAIKGLEQFWDQSNVRSFSYLPYNDIDQEGNAVGRPDRVQSGVDLSAGVALIQQAQQNFYNTTGIYPASLGQQGNEQSGRAIIARQKEGDVSTFHYIDNQTRGKLAGGIILNDLITKTYDGSRIVSGMKADKSIVKIPINQKYKAANGDTKIHDMTEGVYEVVITTGPSYSTKRQEQGDAMLQLASQTNLMEVAPDIFYSTQDWPGAEKIAERYKKTLPPELTEDEDAPQTIPPQIKAQIQQMQAVIEQLQQALQSADEQLQQKETDLQIKEGEFQLKIEAQQSKQETEDTKAENDRLKLMLEAEKVDLEREKVELEREKIQLEGLKFQLDFKAKASASYEEPQENAVEGMGLSKEAILAHLQSLDEKEAIETFEKQLKHEKEAQEDAEEKMRSNMLLENLGQINNQLMSLTQSIAAPKRVVRDPATGMIQGVVTEGE